MPLCALSIPRSLLAAWCRASVRGGDPLSGFSDGQVLTTLPVLVSLLDAQGGALVGDVGYVGRGRGPERIRLFLSPTSYLHSEVPPAQT